MKDVINSTLLLFDIMFVFLQMISEIDFILPDLKCVFIFVPYSVFYVYRYTVFYVTNKGMNKR